ncbi:unnamed protein product [Linum trigynum]|uniref:Uncharacterized protein n=1 Tax=Linum trigynum TaxID=586398 RepID=A0AAV2EEA6_9ROSI
MKIKQSLRLIKNQISCNPHCDHDLAQFNPRTAYPYIILGGSAITTLLRHYFNSRALEAEEEGAERDEAAANERTANEEGRGVPEGV